MAAKKQTAKSIVDKLTEGIFGSRLIENAFRGPYAEYMVAQALGADCAVVSLGWHAWDLQIGRDKQDYPDRIRIQVKNTARLQSWHRDSSAPTECQWILSMRPKPSYFDRDNPGVPCEAYGHLCDLYVLCHHGIDDPAIADHRDPSQWEFYLVPVTLRHRLFPVKQPRTGQKGPPTYNVRPETLSRGIRGRPPVDPVTFDELSIARIHSVLDI